MVNSACPNLIFVYRPFKLRLSRLSGLNLSSLVSINHNYIHSSVWHSVYFACMLSYLIFNIPSICPSVRLSVCLSIRRSVCHALPVPTVQSVGHFDVCLCLLSRWSQYLSVYRFGFKNNFCFNRYFFWFSFWGFEPSFITFFWPSRNNFLTM